MSKLSRWLISRSLTLASQLSCYRWKGARFGFSAQQGLTQMAMSAADRAATECSAAVDLAWPSAAWTVESRQLFDELYARKDLTYLKNEVYPHEQTKNRLFTRSDVENTGCLFNYAMFLNKPAQQMCGVVQFGPYTEGPKNCVHGGASAAMCDAIMGKLVSRCDHSAVLTANLSVDYRALVALNATYYMEANIEKVEGRKVFVSCRFLSPDKRTVHVEGKSLFIKVKLANESVPKSNDGQSSL